jgi:hypothetical protein
MDDGVIVRGVAMVACVVFVGVVKSASESVRVCSAWADNSDGWAVRGPCKTRTDHFAPLVHAPKKTISDFTPLSWVFSIFEPCLSGENS